MGEYIDSGCISAALVASEDPVVKSLRSFLGIYGVGPAKAMSFIKGGIMSIDDLKKRQKEPKLLTKA